MCRRRSSLTGQSDTLKVGGALICSYQPGSHGSNKSGVCNCYSGKVYVGRSVNCMMDEHYN